MSLWRGWLTQENKETGLKKGLNKEGQTVFHQRSHWKGHASINSMTSANITKRVWDRFLVKSDLNTFWTRCIRLLRASDHSTTKGSKGKKMNKNKSCGHITQLSLCCSFLASRIWPSCQTDCQGNQNETFQCIIFFKTTTINTSNSVYNFFL